jgi:hypothetical protein
MAVQAGSPSHGVTSLQQLVAKHWATADGLRMPLVIHAATAGQLATSNPASAAPLLDPLLDPLPLLEPLSDPLPLLEPLLEPLLDPLLDPLSAPEPLLEPLPEPDEDDEQAAEREAPAAPARRTRAKATRWMVMKEPPGAQEGRSNGRAIRGRLSMAGCRVRSRRRRRSRQ